MSLIRAIGSLVRGAFRAATTQDPLPVDGRSIHVSDFDVDNSDFTGWVGDPDELFRSPFSASLTNTTSDNPKQMIIAFNRTVKALQIGFGENNGGDFSNVKVSLLGSGGATRSIFDRSTDSTKLTSLNAEFEDEVFNSLLVEFYTADPVSLSNVTIQKSTYSTVQMQGQDADGVFQTVRTTRDGDLSVSDNSNGLSIAEGNVTGKSFIHKFGEAPDFDTGDGEVTVWDGADDGLLGGGAMVYTYSAIADIDTLSSSDAGDTQNIEVQGLDTNYGVITQTIALNGQTDVILPVPLLRVFRMRNVGSTDFAGVVYLRVTGTAQTAGVPDTASSVRAIVNNGNNQTLMAVYTIPAGKTGYMRDWYTALAGGSKSSNYKIKLRARPLGGVFQLKHTSAIAEVGSSHVQHTYTEPETFQEKTDVEMTVSTTAVGVTGADVSAGFDIVLVDS